MERRTRAQRGKPTSPEGQEGEGPKSSSVRLFAKRVTVKHKEAICETGKEQSTQQHTYQAQMPCPLPGSGSRFKKSQPRFAKTDFDAPLMEVWSVLSLPLHSLCKERRRPPWGSPGSRPWLLGGAVVSAVAR